jgi:hypothetical protein
LQLEQKRRADRDRQRSPQAVVSRPALAAARVSWRVNWTMIGMSLLMRRP